MFLPEDYFHNIAFILFVLITRFVKSKSDVLNCTVSEDCNVGQVQALVSDAETASADFYLTKDKHEVLSCRRSSKCDISSRYNDITVDDAMINGSRVIVLTMHLLNGRVSPEGLWSLHYLHLSKLNIQKTCYLDFKGAPTIIDRPLNRETVFPNDIIDLKVRANPAPVLMVSWYGTQSFFNCSVTFPNTENQTKYLCQETTLEITLAKLRQFHWDVTLSNFQDIALNGTIDLVISNGVRPDSLLRFRVDQNSK
ncbi:uncharacterized protein LOC129922676 isoform X2 [Biomphalaria glabrata]|uniref:Uncharacterized protein LOC129922676 isoform X2 n=1 Tax=Biomphalaria glabrata TaxID=6526 RepID=A0A9W2YRW8_BIOGL|nr:uncharacterized protein LOC129922676 isoform X2 [Biomphalaria glabrata]